MMRIHQQLSGRQPERWYGLGVRCVQAVKHVVSISAAFALFIPLATAQLTSSLNGNVTDPSGAAVANANITLSEAATGFQRKATSNAAGLYQFLEVPPGNYRLEATAGGFNSYSATITLLVKLPSTLNIKFQVAGVAETLTVEGQAPLINRTDASLGNVVEQDQIQELPIADRNVVNLLSLQPGVTYLGIQSQAQENLDTRSGAVNGLRSDQSNVTLDGIGVNDENNGYAFNSVLNVPPDSVEEFRVTTANSTADSGYSSGAQVALVTKSGTNNFHGSAYEYNRNTVFSANDPFIKESQLQNGQPNTQPKLLRNVFGATLGGAIRKNRLFFFTNYEGRRDAQGTSVVRTVPSSPMRQGYLQYLCTLNSDGSLNTAACPGGTVNGLSGVPPGYYALNPTQVTNIDPGNMQNPSEKGPSPAVANILGQYPSPNVTTSGVSDGVNTLGYRFASNADSTFNTYITRVDYHINSSGSQTLFARASMQNFNEPGLEQFPGQSASTTIVDDSRGITIGLTSLINPTLINNFHWGYVRQGGQQQGASQIPAVLLNGLDNLVPFTRSTTFFVPINQFTDTINWTRKNHTLEFGADFFIIRNDRSSLDDSFSDVQTNPVYLNTGGISNTTSPLDPGNNGFPTVDPSFGGSYDQAVSTVLGLFAEGDGVYNFNHAGQALAQGTPINRRYAINNYEFYGQDAWRVKSNLTLTYGLRWVLEAPPYETNGLQVAPCVEAAAGGCTNQNLAGWFNHTAQLMSQGQPALNAGEISFILGGPVNHGPGLWNWDHKDFSPRIAVAWSPDTGDGFASKLLGKKDQFTVRGGYSIMYDHFGVPIVNTFDQHGSFGLSTDLGNPAGVVTVQQTPRFTCLVPGNPAGTTGPCLPAPCAVLQGQSCLYGPTPSGSFPVTPSNSEFAINWGLDSSLKTPYAHVFNFSLARQISSRSSLQIAYVGTVGRRLPMQVDLAQPANTTDPSSKMTYFQGAKMLSQAAAQPNASGPQGVDVNTLQPIPFFENFFPAWKGASVQNALVTDQLACANGNLPANPTTTQNVYELYSCYLHNETLALYYMDVPASITQITDPLPSSKNGFYNFFHDQFASLYAWRNIGTSDYNAMQVTYSVRWGANLQGQFNYTFGKSLDEESAAQRIGPYEGTGGTGNDLNGGGIVINAWDPNALRGLSDFNNRHQINGNLVYRLPFGRNHLLAGNAGSVVNEIIGGWNVSGIFRWTSGFPITVDNGPGWPTDWNIEGDAEPNGPIPKVTNPKNLVLQGNPPQYIGPDMFKDPAAALAAFRHAWPGESGVRNNVIGQGLFDIDTGVAKSFSLGETRRLEFTWQAFNALNSVRYDVRTAQPSLGFGPAQFGAYSSTISSPRFMQFALRFAF